MEYCYNARQYRAKGKYTNEKVVRKEVQGARKAGEGGDKKGARDTKERKTQGARRGE